MPLEHAPHTELLREMEENTLSVVNETSGHQWQWSGGHIDRQNVWPFLLPNDLQGWVPLTWELVLYIELPLSIQLANFSSAERGG